MALFSLCTLRLAGISFNSATRSPLPLSSHTQRNARALFSPCTLYRRSLPTPMHIHCFAIQPVLSSRSEAEILRTETLGLAACPWSISHVCVLPLPIPADPSWICLILDGGIGVCVSGLSGAARIERRFSWRPRGTLRCACSRVRACYSCSYPCVPRCVLSGGRAEGTMVCVRAVRDQRERQRAVCCTALCCPVCPVRRQCRRSAC